MTWQENLFSNLLSLMIILSLILIVYLKITKKTIGDLIRDIKEATEDKQIYDGMG